MPRQERTRELLIENAVRLVEEVGLASFTAREVARRVGVSHAAPFRHFPGRSALLADAALCGYRDLLGRIASVRGLPEGSGRNLVLRRAMEYVVFAGERPALFELMFRPDVVNDAGERVHDHCLGVFAHLLHGADGGAASPHEVSMLAGVHGLAVLAAQGVLGPLAPDRLLGVLDRHLPLALPFHDRARSS